ncbi:hypothetical protein EGR_05880 [Echinococcus granulosus]|uniref:Uncharacterized protein n=1 Tax=Echinococcus granulosus TaxID=6210 RepID=W6V006_ECHGR|nr:hypothetical protein EGR_05880 [Echinococcus granulosus]EUB59279.1 hypothetical protein EGR_05880 [Echinococcus granulosus]
MKGPAGECVASSVHMTLLCCLCTDGDYGCQVVWPLKRPSSWVARCLAGGRGGEDMSAPRWDKSFVSPVGGCMYAYACASCAEGPDRVQRRVHTALSEALKVTTTSIKDGLEGVTVSALEAVPPSGPTKAELQVSTQQNRRVNQMDTLRQTPHKQDLMVGLKCADD